jgi:hypothetical protein
MTKGHRLYGSLIGTSSGSGIFSLKSQQEISMLGAWGSVIRNGLVLHYDTTNPASYPGSGTTLFDLSASALNATGSTAISNQSLAWNQTYSTASTSILNTDVHSIFFSIQINGTTGNWDKIFEYAPSGTDRSPGIWRWPNNRSLHWKYDPGNSAPEWFNLNGPSNNLGQEFAINTWYYVGVVKNGANLSYYVNGNLVGTGTGSNPKTAGNSAIRLFPGYGGSTAFMRHVHIYNRALTTDEVFGNYRTVRFRL